MSDDIPYRPVPDAMRRPDSIVAWTLADAAKAGAMVWECGKCARLCAADMDDLVARYGAVATIAAVRTHMRCRRCGRRQARALVRLRFGRGDRAWVPVPPRASR